MEIKVTYQGQVVGLIDFEVSSAIEKMRELGYASFCVRAQVTKYDYFALFRNEDTEEAIRIYPDKSFMKSNDCNSCKVTFEEVENIKVLLAYYITYRTKEEESE